MKKYIGFLSLIVLLLCFSACKRECICTGVHPATDLVEEHNFGKMTSEDCQDKQLRMNKDTTITTIYTWTCKN